MTGINKYIMNLYYSRNIAYILLLSLTLGVVMVTHSFV